LDEVAAALQPLIAELWQRIAADAATHSRLPTKLGLTWRIGYGKQQSKTVQLSGGISRQMRLLLLQKPSQGIAGWGDGVGSFVNERGCVGVSSGGKGLLQCWSNLATDNSVKQHQQQQAAGVVAQNGEQQQHPVHLGQHQQQGDVVCKLLLQSFLEIVKAAAIKHLNGTSSGARSGKGVQKQRQARPISSEAGSAAAGFNITRLVLAALYADS
jgi:hypothetical protein